MLRFIFLIIIMVLSIGSCVIPTNSGEIQTDLPVFPDAKGFGTSTPAGRGGVIHKVTNLNPSGSGSLDVCVEAQGPRTCIFEVSGTILLTSNMKIKEPFLTIAGQTAPSPGITLRGAGLEISTHDVLIQHLRIRVGDNHNGPSGENRDGVAIVNNGLENDVYNIVIDHLSVSWAVDENMSTWFPGVHDVTISNSIISEGLHDSLHPEGPHSKGFLIGYGTDNISFIGNLFAHNERRSPRVHGDTSSLFVNNLIYNWGSAAGSYGSDYGPLTASIVGNVYIKGTDSKSLPVIIKTEIQEGSQIYVDDNEANEGSEDP